MQHRKRLVWQDHVQQILDFSKKYNTWERFLVPICVKAQRISICSRCIRLSWSGGAQPTSRWKVQPRACTGPVLEKSLPPFTPPHRWGELKMVEIAKSGNFAKKCDFSDFVIFSKKWDFRDLRKLHFFTPK